jgi:aminopeptidase N
MEQVSGKDLSKFFQQWLYQAGYPKLAVQWKYDGSKKELQLKIEQLQPQAQFDFPLEFATQGSAAQFQLHTVSIQNKINEFRFPMQSAPKSLSLDPMVKLLFEAKIEQK